MEFKQIQELVKQINRSHLSEFHLEEGNFKITIKKAAKKEEQSSAQNPPTMQIVNPAMPYPAAQQQMPVASSAPQREQAAQQPQKAEENEEKKAPKEDHFVTIKSPMIGTFYRSPSPDKSVFVNVGDEVSQGKIVCIIEAMKLFNEVESEVSGKIVKILVDDASPVEYDQPLFLVEP